MEKMALAEALALALEELDDAADILGPDGESDQSRAATVLREFRERGLPFYEAAKLYCEAHKHIRFLIGRTQRDLMEAYRRLTTEGE